MTNEVIAENRRPWRVGGLSEGWLANGFYLAARHRFVLTATIVSMLVDITGRVG